MAVGVSGSSLHAHGLQWARLRVCVFVCVCLSVSIYEFCFGVVNVCCVFFSRAMHVFSIYEHFFELRRCISALLYDLFYGSSYECFQSALFLDLLTCPRVTNIFPSYECFLSVLFFNFFT